MNAFVLFSLLLNFERTCSKIAVSLIDKLNLAHSVSQFSRKIGPVLMYRNSSQVYRNNNFPSKIFWISFMIIVTLWLRAHNLSQWFSQFYRKIGPILMYRNSSQVYSNINFPSKTFWMSFAYHYLIYTFSQWCVHSKVSESIHLRSLNKF